MADEPPAARVPKPCCVCDGPGGQHCTKCKSSHYCGKACQLVDWYERGHKAQCKQLAAEFQDRLLESLMPEKLDLKTEEETPGTSVAVVESVAPATGSKAAPRLPAAQKAEVKTGARKDGTPGWRGVCAICFDLLPFSSVERTFYDCCCRIICTACHVKCQEHDVRCPLCRSAPYASDAEWLRRVQKHVDLGDAEAQVVLGLQYHVGGAGIKISLKRAFRLYQLAAAQGHPRSQFTLGCCYDAGDGVKMDHKTAVLWYRRAADQGYPDAQFMLGTMIRNGKGVAQSDEEAVKWFRLSAAQGQSDALFVLGLSYESGKGVLRDGIEALRFYKLAEARGYPDAADSIIRCRAGLMLE